MRSSYAAAALLSAALLAGGCETVSTPTATTPTSTATSTGAKAAPSAPARAASTTSAPVLKAPELPALPPVETTFAAPKLSAEAAALVERLTSADSGTLPHEVTDTTGFPGALSSLEPGAPAPRVDPGESTGQPPARGLTADGNTTALFEKDWTGLVLVPISTSLSKAYTSDVRLTKVEAHPLNDGRVRIWTRVHNIGAYDLPAEIACEFRMQGSHANSPFFYQLDVPARGYRDVFFVSPDGALNAYTVLVRSVEALNSRR